MKGSLVDKVINSKRQLLALCTFSDSAIWFMTKACRNYVRCVCICLNTSVVGRLEVTDESIFFHHTSNLSPLDCLRMRFHFNL